MEMKEMLHTSPSKMVSEWNSQPAKAI